MIRFRPLLIPTLSTLLAFSVLVGLGVWQLQRLEWKQSLIARIEGRIHDPPVPLDTALATGNLLDAEWVPVHVEGRFLHDKETFLYATEFDLGLGVHVITPLERPDGRTVLIDRGWVSNTAMNPSSRLAGQVEGPVRVNGIVRLTAEPNPYAPRADVAKRLWFTRDPAGIAAMAGVTIEAPILVAADETSAVAGGPRFPGWRVNLPNSHLQYALTWFGLALAVLAVYLVYHYSHGRLRFGRRPASA
jgi:surfeit locus 1 family protein